MAGDLDALKKEVARISARQEVLEKQVGRLSGDRKPDESKDAARGAPKDPPPIERPRDIKVPALKVVKMRDEGAAKRARGDDVVTTADRPFGEPGPDVSESGALSLVKSELPGHPAREEQAEPNRVYARALQQFSETDCGNAVVSFEDFVRIDPSNAKASQAVYYIGECYFKRGEYAIALSEFTRLAEQYKEAKQTPMALYMAGLCLKSLKDAKGARQMLEKVKESYPGQEAALLAEKELLKLK